MGVEKSYRLCVDGCGTKLEVGPRGGGRRRCYDCSKRRMVDNITQMHAKKGPVYRKWKQAWALGVARYARAVLDSPIS